MKPYYQDDAATLYHGDCSEVLPAVGVKANLILTSPPYDNLRDYGGHQFDFDRVADTCVGALADGGVLVWVVADATVDGSETGTSFRQALGFMDRGLKLHDTMIYRYGNSNGKTYKARHSSGFEYMFIFSNGWPETVSMIIDKQNKWAGTSHWGTPTIREKDGSLTVRVPRVIPEYGPRDNVWEYKNGHGFSAPDYPDAHDHPAIFPLALAKDHILTWTNPGDLVLDPMAGSGTVLRAAANLGRKAIGVEIHADYLPIITGRMAQQVLL